MSTLSEEKKLYQRLKVLSEAFLLSSRGLDYKSMLRMAARHFKMFTGANASVLLLNNNRGSLIPVCSVGVPFSKIKDTSLPSSARLRDIIARPALDVRYASFLNTPLIQNRKLVGLSAVFSIVPEKFYVFEHDKYESLFLSMLASYVVVNIENATLNNSIAAIERSQFDWEDTFDAIDDLISIHDADFTIIRANMAVAKKFDMDIRDVVGKKCYRIFHGTEEPWKTCPHRVTMETKTTCTEDIEDPHMCGIFNVTTFPRFDKAGKCIGSIHVAKDMTEHKRMWDQLIQSEKMSALGMMIAGIAHEINNPLSVVTGYTQSLLKEGTEKNRFELMKIQKHAERAANIVKQLLGFVRHESATKVHIDIHQVLEEVVSWFTHKLKLQNIRLVREYEKFPLVVNCNVNRVHQVFVNMFSNALDAMQSVGDGVGELLIKTKKERNWVMVIFKDTGCGIPEENLKRIFDPFYTTKEVGKGTGLGLAICYKIIHEHGGNIHVASQVGEGTTFTVEFPLARTTDEKQAVL